MIRVDAASHMPRARDTMDRAYDEPLDIAALARVALTSEAHFICTFKETFGETPHRYLQRRRLERAMALLRETERPVTEICLEVRSASLNSFSRTFTRVVGMAPTAYREAWRTGPGTAGSVPTCVCRSGVRVKEGATVRRHRLRGVCATKCPVGKWWGNIPPMSAHQTGFQRTETILSVRRGDSRNESFAGKR